MQRINDGRISKMTKKEECFVIFEANNGLSREAAIDKVVKEVGVTRSTAITYYPVWRNGFIHRAECVARKNIIKPGDVEKEEKVKTPEIAEKINEITKTVENITEKESIVSETSPCVQNIEPTMGERIKDIFKEFVKPKSLEEDEGGYEVTSLVPVHMQGVYGDYRFSKHGVKILPADEYISREKMAEGLKAIQIWEKCYMGAKEYE